MSAATSWIHDILWYGLYYPQVANAPPITSDLNCLPDIHDNNPGSYDNSYHGDHCLSSPSPSEGINLGWPRVQYKGGQGSAHFTFPVISDLGRGREHNIYHSWLVFIWRNSHETGSVVAWRPDNAARQYTALCCRDLINFPFLCNGLQRSVAASLCPPNARIITVVRPISFTI